MGDRRLIVAAAAAALLAGCGATPPQAPGPQAHQLNEALSAFSGACGDAAQIQAFANDPRDMAAVEHQAQKQVPVLAKIYKQNPNWIFQGKSVADLVSTSSTFLDECGLHAAASQLRKQTSSK